MQGLFLFSAAHQLESVEHYEEFDLDRSLAFSVICHRQNSGFDIFLSQRRAGVFCLPA
jgi:hypothetical protein